jgi:hypothetical protein
MSQNMRLGYPAGPIPAMLRAGVPVGIGVDGAASNDGGSMVGELRLVHLVHRLAGVQPDYSPDRWLTPHDILWMATRHGAAILAREDIGRLAPGCAADAVLIDLRQVGYAGGLHDPLGTLMMAGDCTVRHHDRERHGRCSRRSPDARQPAPRRRGCQPHVGRDGPSRHRADGSHVRQRGAAAGWTGERGMKDSRHPQR